MKENKFLYGLVTGVACSLLIVTVFTGAFYYLSHQGLDSNSGSTDSDKTAEKTIDYEAINAKCKALKQYIDKYYLNKVDSINFADGVYKGMLESLGDPYSVYYTKKEYNALMESSSGSYCGIGAYLSQDAKTGIVTVAKPFPDSPAEKAGIEPGDIIVKVGNTSVTGVDLTKVTSKMKGKEGKKVSLTLQRGDETINVDVTVKKIEVPTISSRMLKDNVGYIQIAEFDEVTAPQFRQAVKDLQAKGMKGLVIDLRDNPGGLLDTVVDILDRIVDKGLLVYTKDKNGQGAQYKADDNDKLNIPMSVLINGNSASASEVFAGAIQDYKLGTLVGTTSFGKGIVQSVIPLSDGSAIKLTVSKYYTPNGRNIHGKGIAPDVAVELDTKTLKPTDPDNMDNQLQKAFDIVKQKINK